MSAELRILLELTQAQITADSLAPTIGLTTEKTIAILLTLKRQNLLTSEPLYGLKQLHIYRITDAGRSAITNGIPALTNQP